MGHILIIQSPYLMVMAISLLTQHKDLNLIFLAYMHFPKERCDLVWSRMLHLQTIASFIFTLATYPPAHVVFERQMVNEQTDRQTGLISNCMGFTGKCSLNIQKRHTNAKNAN